MIDGCWKSWFDSPRYSTVSAFENFIDTKAISVSTRVVDSLYELGMPTGVHLAHSGDCWQVTSRCLPCFHAGALRQQVAAAFLVQNIVSVTFRLFYRHFFHPPSFPPTLFTVIGFVFQKPAESLDFMSLGLLWQSSEIPCFYDNRPVLLSSGDARDLEKVCV